MSIYKDYKHGASFSGLVKKHGLQTVFNSLQKAGLPVRIHNKRIQVLDDITNRWNCLR